MRITYNGCQKEFESGTTPVAVLEAFGVGRDIIVSSLVKVNGTVTGLCADLWEDCTLQLCPQNSEEGLRMFRHSAAHLLAHAVKRIYPTARVATGGAMKDGFFYDFEFKTPIKQTDLQKIASEMRKISKESLPFVREEMTLSDATKLFAENDEIYKLEILGGMQQDGKVVTYRQGDFVDICEGGHLAGTGELKAFKLTGVTGAYWRGNDKKRMLTRIHGIAFGKESDLEKYMELQKEAEDYRHNTLGKKLGYFTTEAIVGRGLPILLPKGAFTVRKISSFTEEREETLGYMPIISPLFGKSELFRRADAKKNAEEALFYISAGRISDSYVMRSSSVPMHYTVYKSGLKSYKDLPVKYFETGRVFMRANSGEIKGLTIADQYTANSACALCKHTDLLGVIKEDLKLSEVALKGVGIWDVAEFYLLVRGKNRELYMGDGGDWDFAESEFIKALDSHGIEYKTVVAPKGEWGPRLEARVKLSDGRNYVVSEVKVDIANMESYDLKYVDDNGEKNRPIGVICMPLGYLERTLGVMIERLKGRMPLWLAPEQVRVISLTERTAEDAKNFAEELKAEGVRATFDTRDIKMSIRLKKSFSDFVPYTVLIGDKEKVRHTLNVNVGTKGTSEELSVDDFIAKIKQEIANKVII